MIKVGAGMTGARNKDITSILTALRTVAARSLSLGPTRTPKRQNFDTGHPHLCTGYFGITPYLYRIYTAASASLWLGKSLAYLGIPTMVKTLLKCAESPKAQIFCPALAASINN